MTEPKYNIDDFIKASNKYSWYIGVIVGIEYDVKTSEWNMNCSPEYEDDSNQGMWSYKVYCIGKKKPIKIYEDEIDGIIEVRRCDE